MQHPIDLDPPASAPPASPAEAQARVLPLRRGPEPVPAERPAAPNSDDSAPSHSSSQRPGVPRGWRPAAQCGWCRIGLAQPGLLDELHRIHVHQGLGARSLTAVARRRLEGCGETVPSARAMSRHVAGHLDRSAYRLDESEHDQEDAIEDREAGWVPRELRELWRIHRRIECQLRKLDAALAITGQNGEPDLNRMAQVAGLTNAARATLLSISRIRGSVDLTVSALRHAVNTAMMDYNGIVVPAIMETIAFADSNGASARAVADRFRALTAPGGRVDTAAKKARDKALEDTLQRLRIEWRPPPAPPPS